jgi:Kiwa KwaB-like protein
MPTVTQPFNLFAGVVSPTDDIQPERIRLERALQDEITSMFAEQADAFLHGDLEKVDFNPKANYRLEREQVFVIKALKLPASYSEAALKPHSVTDFALSPNSAPQIVTVFATDATATRVKRVLFQQFRSPQLLDKRFALFWSQNQFQRISSDGFSLAHELAAIHQSGNLYFRSLAVASRFFDLEEFQPEATTAEIASFVGNTLFAMDDESEILSIIESDSWLRRRVASIESSRKLQGVKPRQAADKAKVFAIDIKVAKNKIRLPKEKKSLKAVVKFLNEEYFHGELTSQPYETNSLRPFAK